LVAKHPQPDVFTARLATSGAAAYLPMSLSIYNTLTRVMEKFSPIEPGHVRMYVCGVTVYDRPHIGNARSAVAFDVVRRWLEASGLRVQFVRNITDIDDKMIRRAVDNGETVRSLAERMTALMYQDYDALNVLRPTHDPRATDYLPQMLEIVGQLQDRGLAYVTPGHDVNFAVRRLPGYGKLSGKPLDELQSGERVAVSAEKQDPLDFVLWKAAKPEEPEDAKWDSPGVAGGPAGTSSARPWPVRCWARRSTSTAAVPTWSFRTTKTRSPKARVPLACRWRAPGCTTVF
jgi:cysteinyl-tRNA synthetase